MVNHRKKGAPIWDSYVIAASQAEQSSYFYPEPEHKKPEHKMREQEEV